MINDVQDRHLVSDLDSVAAEIADDLIAGDDEWGDEESTMRKFWLYEEALHRALMKSGMRQAQASDICNELRAHVLEALNRMRQR
jgi:hypothetical protein